MDQRRVSFVDPYSSSTNNVTHYSHQQQHQEGRRNSVTNNNNNNIILTSSNQVSQQQQQQYSPNSSSSTKIPGQLPRNTVAVPVVYIGSSDATGLSGFQSISSSNVSNNSSVDNSSGSSLLVHFYRIIVPAITTNSDNSPPSSPTTTTNEFNNNTSFNSNVSSNNSSSQQQQQQQKQQFLIEEDASPVIYVVSQGNLDPSSQNSSSPIRNNNSSNVTPSRSNSNSISLFANMGSRSSPQHHHQHQSSYASNNNNNNNGNLLQSLLFQTIEFARVQCLVMSTIDAQKLLDEAGCVPSRYWNKVSLSAMCASADFPIASATASSCVGKVFIDTSGHDINNNNNSFSAAATATATTSRIAVQVSLTRARRVIHIMNDYIVSSESSATAKLLRACCASLWYALALGATEEALEFVRPTVLSGSALTRACHAARLIHVRRVKKRRESLFTVDVTAGAVIMGEFSESRTLTHMATSVKQQVYRSIGAVTDLVGSAMRYDVDWTFVERPNYGRDLRRTHFRPLLGEQKSHHQQHHHSSPKKQHHSHSHSQRNNNNKNNSYFSTLTSGSTSSTTTRRTLQQQHQHHHFNNDNDTFSYNDFLIQNDIDESEPIFLWSKALPPIPVVLARQGWERLVQSDPVMWRFKSLPVRLKETTTKLSRMLGCSVSNVFVSESSQLARSTVLRSLPWTPGDVCLLVDGLVPGFYTALASFLHENNGVVIHTLGMAEPLPNSSEAIVAALGRAIDIVKPLVCIIPHITRCGNVLPIDLLVPLCRERKVVVIVDGTDVLNNVATQVGLYSADFYIAPLDSHMFCPSGLTAVVVSKTRKEAISTLTVSYFFGQGFEEEWTYTGLTDQTRMISIIQALQFGKNVCPDQSQYTRQLASQAHDFLTKFWNVESIYRSNNNNNNSNSNKQEIESSIIAVLLPLAGQQRHEADAKFLQSLLFRRNIFVDIMVVKFVGNNFKLVVRLVFYPYNDMLEVKRLAIGMQQAIQEIS